MECSILGRALQPCLARFNFDKFESRLCSWVGNGSSNNALISANPKISNPSWRVYCTPLSLEEEFMSAQSKNVSNDEVPDDDGDDEASEEDAAAQPPSSEELKALLVDSQRSKLLKKLGEANQQNRLLKRQLLEKEDDLVNFKSELAVVELEIQALVTLAEEIANYTIPEGSRKIKGKYIQSHLLSRLKAVQEKLEEQIKDVEASESREVSLSWHGMAESVQVMGSFDGWSQGEDLSPEYTGSYTTFSTTLMLRPGRYEIKFLIDSEWHISPEFPVTGKGMTQNNLLVVE